MIFYKWNGCYCRFYVTIGKFRHFGIFIARFSYHGMLCIFPNRYFFPYIYLITGIKHYPYDQTQNNLSVDFEFPGEAGFIFLKYFNIIIQKAYSSQPDCRQQHQQNIYICQIGKQ